MTSSSRRPHTIYTVLTEKDILQREKQAIIAVSEVLYLSKVEAAILLRRFKWDVSDITQEWFRNEDKVRMDLGLLENPVVEVRPSEEELHCGICFDCYLRSSMKAAACGHHYCKECWTSYIHTSINEGPGCLTLRCQDAQCSAVVDEDKVLCLVSDEDRTKYTRYLLRSYVEDNRDTKRCPAPGCEYAVEFVLGSGPYDVKCKCAYKFCWNCCEEAHRPVDYHTVQKWILKNSAESENINWILENTRLCPKCKRPIEKIRGSCMHITCALPRKFEFF